MTGCLDGVRVLELARFQAGPRGGMLLSDDVNSTEAFPRFVREQGRRPTRLARGMALLQK